MNATTELQDSRLMQVQDYYGKTLASKDDLVTNVCTVDGLPPQRIRDVLELLHPEVKQRFYGCGTPFPPYLEGASVLDLGCGTGRDCFVLSKMVGEHGQVIGVDVTPEQIAFARQYIAYHQDAFGYAEPNVRFYEGSIERLGQLNLPPESLDIIVSNCVINLAEAKADVLAGMMQLLKPGGEVYFADIFANRRLPLELRDDAELVGECIGDVQYFEDFVRLVRRIGYHDVRVVASSIKSINNPRIEARLGGAILSSMTVRIFKLELEDRCEDYGQAAVYNGALPEAPQCFVLDLEHRFDTGRVVPICKNTADMLSRTRYADFFEILGNGQRHYGIFPCGAPPVDRAGREASHSPTGCGC